jgi:hypothetical protein
MRWWWQPPCLLRSVIVNLKGDEGAIEGILWSSRGSWLVVRQPTLLRPGRADATTVDGEVVIPRANVSFIQAVP